MLKSLVNTNPLSPPPRSLLWAADFVLCGEEAVLAVEDGWNTGTTEVTSSCGDRKKQQRADWIAQMRSNSKNALLLLLLLLLAGAPSPTERVRFKLASRSMLKFGWGVSSVVDTQHRRRLRRIHLWVVARNHTLHKRVVQNELKTVLNTLKYTTNLAWEYFCTSSLLLQWPNRSALPPRSASPWRSLECAPHPPAKARLSFFAIGTGRWRRWTTGRLLISTCPCTNNFSFMLNYCLWMKYVKYEYNIYHNRNTCCRGSDRE